MRSTYEIVADLKNGKKVPYEELRMACLVQDRIVHFFQNDMNQILAESKAAEAIQKLNCSNPKTSLTESEMPSWCWKAIHADPIDWMGPSWITDIAKEQWSSLMNVSDEVKLFV